MGSDAAGEGADKEDLGQFGAGVEEGGADVVVELGDGGKLGVWEGGPVQVGGLLDQAGVGG